MIPELPPALAYVLIPTHICLHRKQKQQAPKKKTLKSISDWLNSTTNGCYYYQIHTSIVDGVTVTLNRKSLIRQGILDIILKRYLEVIQAISNLFVTSENLCFKIYVKMFKYKKVPVIAESKRH